MAKGIRLGVGGVKVSKKVWVGVGGVARKVKKIFAGIGGVKLLFSSELSKIADPTPLSQARYAPAGASNANYALIGGGVWADFGDGFFGWSKVVDAYNTSLVRSTPTGFATGRSSSVGATIGDYAIFAGGWASGSMKAVDAYNLSLVRSNPTDLSYDRELHAAAKVGNYVLYAGGYNNIQKEMAYVDSYNTSLSRGYVTDLSSVRFNLAGASVGTYALFGGGRTSSSIIVATVDAYNSSLVRSTATSLLQAREYLTGTSAGNYALFAGGASYGTGSYDVTSHNIVEAYDTSLVRTAPTTLSRTMYSPISISMGEYTLIACDKTVNCYDASLVRTLPTELTVALRESAAAKVGSYSLFAGGGGYDGISTTYRDTVEAYEG